MSHVTRKLAWLTALMLPGIAAAQTRSSLALATMNVGQATLILSKNADLHFPDAFPGAGRQPEHQLHPADCPKRPRGHHPAHVRHHFGNAFPYRLWRHVRPEHRRDGDGVQLIRLGLPWL